jgi:hypothetical protein
VLGVTRTATISAVQPATTSRTYTIPDVSADASFVLTQGAQTIAGTKTFSSAPQSSTGINLGNYIRRSNNSAQTIPSSGGGGITGILWDTAIANNGITYSAGVFTLPVAGVYQCSATLRLGTALVTKENVSPGFSISESMDFWWQCSETTSIFYGLQTILGGLAGGVNYGTTTATIRTTGANATVQVNCFGNTPSTGNNSLVGGLTNYNFVAIYLIQNAT